MAAPANAEVVFTPWPSSPFETAFAGTPTGPALLERVDLNADPRPDLVSLSGQTVALTPRPSPGFAAGTPVALGSPGTLGPSSSGDVDGDGRRDLVTWTDNSPDHYQRVWRGLSSGLTGGSALNDQGLVDSALGDINGDGRADQLRVSASTSVVVGTAAGAFSNQPANGAVALGLSANNGVIADLNGDGKGDVILAGTDSNGSYVKVLLGPTLTTTAVTVRPAFRPARMVVADANGDGKLDVIGTQAGAVELYSGNGAGSLAAPLQTALANTTPNAAAADFDGDGFADVAVTTTAQDRIFVLPGRATGGFGTPVPLTTVAGVQPRGALGDIVSADFDTDGDQDLAFASRSGYRVDVLRNDSVRPPAARTDAPSALAYETATLAGGVDLKGASGTVSFQWGTTANYANATPDQSVAPGPAGERPVKAELTGLLPNTEYHARVIAKTGAGNNVGQDVTFRTTEAPPADHTAAIIEAPQRVVAGVPERLRGTASGSFPPYTLSWAFKDDGTADGDSITHGFAPVPLDTDQAAAVGGQGAGDGGTKRGSRHVTLTATDRFGRAKTAETDVTILPNRAPIAGVSAAGGVLEYAEPNTLVNESSDPDTGPNGAYDYVAKTVFSFGAGGSVEQRADSEAQPIVMPWRAFRGRAPLLADINFGPKVLQKIDVDSVKASYDRPALLAAALDQYAATYCGKPALYMLGCWPHPTALPVTVTATDRAGASTSKEVSLPIRPRARPAADMTLRNPAVETVTGDAKSSNQELPAGISTATELFFDPSTTVVDRHGKDSKEAPVAYVLQIGKPWQLQCASANKKPILGIVQPDYDVQLRQVAKEILLDNPLEGPGLDNPALVGSEAIGARASVGARASAARRAPTAGGQPGTVISLGKGCINGTFGVNTPIRTIVTADKNALRTAIPQEGTWSAMLSVYDRIGARGNVRLDGIVVGPTAKSCAPEQKKMDDSEGRNNGFSWTGTCVSSVTDSQIYWTPNPIDLNGVRLAPAAGKFLVVEGKPSPRVWSAATAPTNKAAEGAVPDFDLKNWKAGDGGSISVVVDDQSVATLKASHVPPIRRVGGPKSDRVVLDGAFVGDLKANTEAYYGGLPYTGTINVDLTHAPSGCTNGSLIKAQLKLPTVFGDATTDKAQTSPLELPGCNHGKASLVNKKGDGGLSPQAARKAKASKATAARDPKARRAVDVPPVSLDLGGIALGPLEFAKLKLDYDPASGAFRGTGAANLFGQMVEVTVAITDGELTEASGRLTFAGGVGVNIPGTPVNLRSIIFGVETSPLKFVGGAELTDPTGNIVSVTGTLGFQPDPLKITLDGVGALGPGGAVSLASMHLEVADGEVSIGAHVGKSYGPFSYEVNVSGSFSSYGFNVEGSGRACVFACLGVNGVLSDRGAAVCGEIDLWVKTFRPGLGVHWSPFDVDGYLDGCSVAPYRGNIKPGGAKASRLAVGDPVTVSQGQELLTAVASSGVAGRPPNVSLAGPGGVTITPPADQVDDQKVINGVVIDVDRIAGTVRFVVPSPAVGEWKVVANAPDPPLADVQYAGSAPLPDAKQWNTSVGPAGNRLPEKVFGTLLTAGTKGPAFKRTPKKAVTEKIKLKGQKKPVKQAVAVGYGHQLNSADLGPDTRALLKTVKLSIAGLQPGDEVALVERSDAPSGGAPADDATSQAFVQFTVPASGQIDDEATFLPGVNGVRARHIDAYVTSSDGTPRGVVKNVDGFKSIVPIKPKLPSLKSLKPSGGKLKLIFSGAPSVGTKSRAVQLKAVITGKDGSVRVIPVQGTDFKKSGKNYTVTINPAGAAKGASVKLVSVGLAGKTLKGGNKVKTVKVK